jgi:hypothetical protein
MELKRCCGTIDLETAKSVKAGLNLNSFLWNSLRCQRLIADYHMQEGDYLTIFNRAHNRVRKFACWAGLGWVVIPEVDHSAEKRSFTTNVNAIIQNGNLTAAQKKQMRSFL